MSEPKPEYITEAEQMMGTGYEPAAIIEQPSRRLVLRDGLGEEWTVAWVKLSTAFKPHIKEIRGAPLAVWLYIALSVNKQGVSFPSINKIAEDTGYSRNGVMDAIKELEEKGYMKVRRGERKFNLYEPEFAAIGKMNEPSNESTQFTSPLLPPDESTFSPNESSVLDLNKSNKSNKKLSFSEIQEVVVEANQSMDKQIEFMTGREPSWQGRELIRADLLPLADWYNSTTNQVMTKRVQKSWWKALGEWKEEGLQPEHLQIAFDAQSKWRMVSDPNMLTKDAVAIKASGITKLEEPKIEYTRML
ncbi:MAG: helix-turn-helix domain-containing protein [Candidatus Berkelbacteria bacterium]|nr:helix-turn-helix domain-containing protein [Candidatus Berkelbacteria bacterium]